MPVPGMRDKVVAGAQAISLDEAGRDAFFFFPRLCVQQGGKDERRRKALNVPSFHSEEYGEEIRSRAWIRTGFADAPSMRPVPSLSIIARTHMLILSFSSDPPARPLSAPPPL